MKYYLYSVITYILFLNACIREDQSGCFSDKNESEVLVRVVGDYTHLQLSKLDLWIETSNHDNWFMVRHYSEVEIAGKDYIKIMLPVGQPYRFVALGNALESSMVVAPLPQNQDYTRSGNNPLDNSMVRYISNGSFNMPVDNLFMGMPVAFQHNAVSTFPEVDIPIDCIVSLVRLHIKCPSLMGMQAKVTIFNSAEGVRFNSEQLPANLPVLNRGIIDKNDYTLNTIIFPSLGATSDIRILVQINDLYGNEIYTFEQKDIQVSPKQIYAIIFDGMTFDINAKDWDGNIDVDSGIN